jgi:hypothetical protein
LKQHTDDDPEGSRYGSKAKRGVQREVIAVASPADDSCQDADESDEGQELKYEFHDFEDCHVAAFGVGLSPQLNDRGRIEAVQSRPSPVRGEYASYAFYTSFRATAGAL